MQDLVIEWKEDGTHLYEQIYQYIRDEIRRGKLLCQEKLPSTRSLAEYLQVSRSTVELAYDQLVAEGYLEAVPYKGYFVARVEELYQMETAPEAGITSHEQAGSFSRADAGGDCLFLSDAACASKAALDDSSAAVPVQIDFSPNAIDMRNFPFDLWRKVNRNKTCFCREIRWAIFRCAVRFPDICMHPVVCPADRSRSWLERETIIC